MKSLFSRVCILALCLFYAAGAFSESINIIPRPASMTAGKGVFTLKGGQTIGCADESLRPAAEYLQSLLQRPSGMPLNVVSGKGVITLSVDTTMTCESAYNLSVTPSSVTVTAGGYKGVVCAIATIRQLLPSAVESAHKVKGRLTMPCVKISDAPYYEWRGLHLDVSRHFFTVGEVKDFLNLMSLYKFNKFHWHLTDDQGWRIEIKRYPLLTAKGAWRKLNNQDRMCLHRAVSEDNTDFLLPESKLRVENGDTLYGGFYTQDDIREVVSYAARLGIDVIPEIDMPGHILCAIHNYDGISCSENTGWGELFSSPLCPGKESALEFCRNVYDEVCRLFPYGYVHLGADEVDKTNWKKCPDCQSRMKALGLDNEEQLQAWFVKYMEMFLNSRNKRLIGWDEIVEGGLSKSATISWWRGWSPDAVAKAIEQGNEVILCPNTYCYFDYQPDNSSVKSVYEASFISQPLTESQQHLIKGIQANLWSEYIPTVERLQYMAFPRALAIAERAWTPLRRCEWNSFNNRVKSHIDRLYDMGVNYYSQGLENYIPHRVFTSKCTVRLDCHDRYTQVRYTTDGTVPTPSSRLYTKPFTIDKTTTVRTRLYNAKGKFLSSYDITYERQDYKEAVSADVADGIKIDWYDYAGEEINDITTAAHKATFTEDAIVIPSGAKGNIGLVMTGYVDVPADDVYTFSLLSDDGSDIVIDGAMVVDNGGAHASKEVAGQVALRKGLHAVRVRYFDHNGGVLRCSVLRGDGTAVKLRMCHAR